MIVEHPGLAATMEAYLLNDLEIAATRQRLPGGPGRAAATACPGEHEDTGIHRVLRRNHHHRHDDADSAAHPDPGEYATAVKALIASAQTKLHMQFQYIEPPKITNATSQAFVDLISAVIERQNTGVEIKIITSEFQKAGY